VETRHPRAPRRLPARSDGPDRFLARRPEQVLHRPRHTDGFVLGRALLFMMFLVAIDVKDFWDKSGSSARYALVLIPLGAAALIRVRYRGPLVRRWSAPDRILFVLMAYGLAGSVYGRVTGDVTSGAVPVFVPMLIAFTYLATLSGPTEEEAVRLVRGLAVVGLVYAFFNAVANAGASFIAPKTYRNSKILYVAMGIAAAISSRRKMVTLALFVLAAFIFLSYPSGTDAVVIVTALATWFITKPRGSPVRPVVTMAIGGMIFLIALLNFGATTGLAAEYFHAVGKKNNNNARIALYTGAVHQIEQSPIYGTGFTGNITEYVVRQEGTGAPFKAPFHDDYLMFAAVGGGLALVLLILWVAATEKNVLRRYRGFLVAGEPAKALLLRSLLIGFNTLFVAALFNPELEAVGRGATVFGIYAMMMMVGEPALVGGRERI
jgi:O-Antigen ligase